jgi:molecular chaperone GrpE
MDQPEPNTRGSNEEQASSASAPRAVHVARPSMDAELEDCLAQVAEAKREAGDLKNRYMRAAAEVENVRKQAVRDATTRSIQDKRRFLLDFLEVADSLERVLSQPGESPGLREGINLSLRQMQQVLARVGVERMTVKAGDTFDPVYHEAVEVRAGNVSHDIVVEVVRPGYLHEGVVLRPAQVIVARGRKEVY